MPHGSNLLGSRPTRQHVPVGRSCWSTHATPPSGALVEKDLSVRVHECPTCGLSIDRDVNAALNILRLGLQSLALGA